MGWSGVFLMGWGGVFLMGWGGVFLMGWGGVFLMGWGGVFLMGWSGVFLMGWGGVFLMGWGGVFLSDCARSSQYPNLASHRLSPTKSFEDHIRISFAFYDVSALVPAIHKLADIIHLACTPPV